MDILEARGVQNQGACKCEDRGSEDRGMYRIQFNSQISRVCEFVLKLVAQRLVSCLLPPSHKARRPDLVRVLN